MECLYIYTHYLYKHSRFHFSRTASPQLFRCQHAIGSTICCKGKLVNSILDEIQCALISVRTKPPAYELHEHQNELCYIKRQVCSHRRVGETLIYAYIFHTRIGKNIYTYTARFAGDSMRKDIPCWQLSWFTHLPKKPLRSKLPTTWLSGACRTAAWSHAWVSDTILRCRFPKAFQPRFGERDMNMLEIVLINW